MNVNLHPAITNVLVMKREKIPLHCGNKQNPGLNLKMPANKVGRAF